MPKIIFLAAPGHEPVELVVPFDYLSRAGAEVTIAAVGTSKLAVTAVHGIIIHANVFFNEIKDQMYDAVIAPGGMPGTTNLAKDKGVVQFIKKHFEAGKYCGSLCAAPGFLFAEACGIMKGKKGCGFPGCDKSISHTGGTLLNDPVVVDGNIITSKAAGTAPLFAFVLIELLFNKEKAEEIAEQVINNY